MIVEHHRQSWLDLPDNLRLWHEAGWWARLMFRLANLFLRVSPTARALMIRAARWHGHDTEDGSTVTETPARLMPPMSEWRRVPRKRTKLRARTTRRVFD